jgi:hypothetical protein
MIAGYTGYVFVCDDASERACLKQRMFTCKGDAARTVQRMRKGSVIFLFNPKSSTLVGPFTAKHSGVRDLEPGAWITDTSHDFPARFGVEWEELHELKSPTEKFPFLANLQTCELSETRTLELLQALKRGPPVDLTRRGLE